MSENRPIRVMLVDDHTVVRDGLSAVLMVNEDLELVAEAGNGEEAIRKCELERPDVVLMDLMMPVIDGVEATRAIMERAPGTKIIALTSYKEKELVEGALKAGAIGYLLKNVSAGDLVNAIRNAMLGQPSLSPEATQALIQGISRPSMEIGHDLTERERSILALMAEGASNAEIADRLIVSQSTVKFHVSNILSKLGVTSRTEAVALAIKNKLVD